MSAFFAYIGKKEPYSILRGGIAVMQQGGEVCGITLKTKDGFQGVKTVGNVCRLEEEPEKLTGEGFMGLAATALQERCVGAQSAVPAVNEQFCAVCGGNILPFNALRRAAPDAQGIATDDALLLSVLCSIKAEQMTVRMVKAAAELGAPSFAFIPASENVIYAHSGDVLFAGYGAEGALLSSELAPLVAHCEKFAVIRQGESVRMRSDKMVFYDAAMHKIKKSFAPLGGRVRQESHAVPTAWQLHRCALAAGQVYSTLVRDGRLALDSLKLTRRRVEKLSRIIVVGAGASYAVALYAAAALDMLTDIPSAAYPSGEWMCARGALGKNVLLLAISQSGETPETLACVRRAQAAEVKTLGVTGSAAASLAFLCDMPLVTGEECDKNGDFSAFVSGAAAVLLTALHIGVLDGVVSELYRSMALKMAELLSGKISAAVKDSPAALRAAEIVAQAKTVYTCGTGLDGAAAEESARVLRQTAGVACTAVPPSELIRFPSELTGESAVLFFISSHEAALQMQPRLSRLKVRGAQVILITTENTEAELNGADCVISISDTLPMYHPLPCAAAVYNLAQLLSERNENAVIQDNIESA